MQIVLNLLHFIAIDGIKNLSGKLLLYLNWESLFSSNRIKSMEKMKFKCQVYACHDGDLVDLVKIGKLQKRVLKVV